MACSSVTYPWELHFLIKILDSNCYINTSKNNDGIYSLQVTTKGYIKPEEDRNSNLNSETGFVAMSFSEDMAFLYDQAIMPGIQQSGHDSIRIDRVEHNENINDRIRAEIKKSKFVVADFTSHRKIKVDNEERFFPIAGVYFEAGFAHGLGIPVIWTCKSDQIRDIHFDTSHFNHIAWDNCNELKDKLTVRIEAVVGRGPK